MEPHILVKYASRSRPKRFAEGMENIWSLAATPKNISVLCNLDDDDPFVEDYRSYMSTIKRGEAVVYSHGRSRSKVDAINRRPPHWMQWDILVNFSDDMRFVVYGWDQLIREGVRCNGPDVFLHYPDSTAKNMLPTMSVMDRAYYERDGFIYFPDYWSVFCDNEAMEVAKLRGRYVYCGTQIYDHFHPAYGHVPWDEQYERQQAMWGHDETLYKHRCADNFYLDQNGQYTFVKHSYPDDPVAAG